MTQVEPNKHTDPEGRTYDVTAPALPDLAPGEMRTTLPERWCTRCQQLRPKRFCAIGHAQLATVEPPPEVELERLAAEVGARIPVRVVELDARGVAGGAQYLPDELELPPDDDDAQVDDDGPGDDGPGDDDDDDDEGAAPGDDDDDTGDVDPPELELGAPALEQPVGKLGMVAKLAAAARTRATEAHVAVEDLTRRERLIAARPKGPMARGIQERSRVREWQPLHERTNRRNQPMTARPMSSRQRDVDERGREVQRTEGRTRTRSVEDQLITLWQKATINTLRWDAYFAAAMQQTLYDEAGKPFAPSPAEAADVADQMYIQLLVREKYATD